VKIREGRCDGTKRPWQVGFLGVGVVGLIDFGRECVLDEDCVMCHRWLFSLGDVFESINWCPI